MTTITLEQVKGKTHKEIYDYLKDNNLDGKDLNTIARAFFGDGEIFDFFFFVEVFNLEQYLDEYKDVLIENIKTRNEFKATLLHYISYYGHLEIAQLLIDKKADVNARDKDGNTPLHLASYRGRTEIVKLLIKNGADVSARNKYNETPLYLTSYHGRLEIARLLIEKDADVNAKDRKGNTPLHNASQYGNLAIAELLIEKGAKK